MYDDDGNYLENPPFRAYGESERAYAIRTGQLCADCARWGFCAACVQAAADRVARKRAMRLALYAAGFTEEDVNLLRA